MIVSCKLMELTDILELVIPPWGDSFIQIKNVPEYSEVQI